MKKSLNFSESFFLQDIPLISFNFSTLQTKILGKKDGFYEKRNSWNFLKREWKKKLKLFFFNGEEYRKHKTVELSGQAVDDKFFSLRDSSFFAKFSKLEFQNLWKNSIFFFNIKKINSDKILRGSLWRKKNYPSLGSWQEKIELSFSKWTGKKLIIFRIWMTQIFLQSSACPKDETRKSFTNLLPKDLGGLCFGFRGMKVEFLKKPKLTKKQIDSLSLKGVRISR